MDPPAPAPPGQADQDCANSIGNPPVGSVSGGKRCQQSTGRCLACLADGDWAGNPDGTLCSVSTGRCGCRDEASCAPDLVCGY